MDSGASPMRQPLGFELFPPLTFASVLLSGATGVKGIIPGLYEKLLENLVKLLHADVRLRRWRVEGAVRMRAARAAVPAETSASTSSVSSFVERLGLPRQGALDLIPRHQPSFGKGA
eukprot:scaffold1712_cov261-Pinguiococcus_pyrenoidosus.AAC.20